MGCCASTTKENTVNQKFDTNPDENQSMLGHRNKEGGNTNGTNNIIPDSESINKNTRLTKRNSSQKNKHTNTASEQKSRHYKILLLGPGMSGKTTLFKQMKKLHGTSYTTNEFRNCKPHLTANLIEAFRKLCIYSDILAEQQQANNETKVSAENRDIRDTIARLNDRKSFTEELLAQFNRLLLDPGIQKTLEHRYQFQLSDNFDYLIQNMHLYCDAAYVPTYEDYLHVKQRTVGIQRLEFKLFSKHNKNKVEYYNLHDAGGQRTERKKWMKVISGATAYIFVAAISGYNQSLWEEPSYNRMKEAIHLFRRIYHMDTLSKAHVILFLNKYDLFEKKIAIYSIKDDFHEFTGKETAESVSKWIVEKFKEQQDPKYGLNANTSTEDASNNNNELSNENSHSIETRRSIYFHFTSATDTECVNRVFELCRDIIVLNTLSNIGFV